MMRNEHTVALKEQSLWACECSRFSSLFAARDFSQESLPWENSLAAKSDERRLYSQTKFLHIANEIMCSFKQKTTK